MNTWMNNPQYRAQVGHTLGGYALIVTVLALGHGWMPVLVTYGLGILAAAVKEFWYDARYELPRQTEEDNLIDFGFYVVGGTIGLGVCAWVLR